MKDIISHVPANASDSPGCTFALVDLRSGRTYPLQPGPNSIGRSARNRIVLDDPAVSRRHAVVMVHDNEVCEIGDADSRNGVFLNGSRLRDIAPLSPGHLLQIDVFRLLFIQSSPEHPLPPSFTDETLGVVVWNDADACWYFGITLGVNRYVAAAYSPREDTRPESLPPSSPEWESVRALVRQARSRQVEVRAIAESDAPLGKSIRLPLVQIQFTSTNAIFVYEKPGTGAVWVTIDREGAFVSRLVWIRPDSQDD